MTDTGRPTRTSTWLVAGLTIGAIVLLLGVVSETPRPTLVGVAGAVTLAVALGALSGSGRDGVRAGLFGFLVVPLGASLLVAVFGTALLVGQSVFPVADRALISARSLVVVGHVGLALGCVVAAFGVALAVRSRFEQSAVTTATHITVVAGILPTATGIVLLSGTVLRGDSEASDLVNTAIETGVGIVLAPESPGLHLATFLFIVAVWAACSRLALDTLPVAELLADRGLGRASERRVSAVAQTLMTVTIIASLLAVPAFLVQLELSRSELTDLISPGLYSTIRSLTTAAPLRVLLVGTGALALAAVVGSVAVRRSVRQSGATRRIVGAIGGGAALTVCAAVLAQPAYDWFVTATADRLPGATESQFREVMTLLADAFGEVTLVTLVTAGVAGVTATALALFALVLWLDYLDERTAGVSLGAAGLFVGTAFAGTLGATFWLVASGVLASLVVWDLGQFGSTLGREMGRHTETRSVELVHAGASVAVGLVGVGVALALGTVDLPTVSVSVETVAALALVASGLVALVVSLTAAR
ncbi:DUF7519 family protein [Halovenus marina]|uniref:DUF7519 family protein n=1 Tax=Halovenus marina TaxID=3396621 RepID=UPI003F574AE2